MVDGRRHDAGRGVSTPNAEWHGHELGHREQRGDDHVQRRADLVLRRIQELARLCAVSIDGGAETFIDLYANDPIGFCALAYASPLLTPGLHTLKVRVATEMHDPHGGTTVSLDHFDIFKGTSTIAWQNPADIAYGTPLDATQLNATANVPGTFTYTPPAGTLLPAGQNQTLFVQFTPTDSADYFPAAASVSININKADPQVEWDDIESIFYGQPLTSTQLDATANVPGTFDYNPGLGSILPTRTEYPLTAIFTPTDTADYNSVMVNNKFDIFPATPTFAWSNPADIQLGTRSARLSSTPRRASRMLPLSGTFSYSPPAGTILGLGQNQPLQVTFTPSDSTDFVLATATVHINVNPLTVVNTNDSGAGSLRQTLLDAGNLPGTTHTILFPNPGRSADDQPGDGVARDGRSGRRRPGCDAERHREFAGRRREQ